MSRKEILERAYGNVPKEPPGLYNFNWIPDARSVKYYYLRLMRFFTR